MSAGALDRSGQRQWLSGPLPDPSDAARGRASDLPRVTVVTPSFNQGAYLEETIRSVLMQGYPNLEYIIMDGGSTDNSVDIIRRYEPWLATWTSAGDGGQSAAINAGWRRATGEIVAWQNADDAYCEGAIHNAVRTLQSDPSLAMAYGHCIAIDANGRRFATLEVPRAFSALAMLRSFNNIVPSTTAFIRKSVVDEIGPLDTSLHYTMDFEYVLRLGLRHPAAFDEGIRSLIRVHDDAKSTKGLIAGLMEMYGIVRRLKEASSDRTIVSACIEGLAIGATRLSLAHGASGDFAAALRWRAISLRHALTRPLSGSMLALLVPGRMFPGVRRYRADGSPLGVRMVPIGADQSAHSTPHGKPKSIAASRT